MKVLEVDVCAYDSMTLSMAFLTQILMTIPSIVTKSIYDELLSIFQIFPPTNCIFKF